MRQQKRHPERMPLFSLSTLSISWIPVSPVRESRQGWELMPATSTPLVVMAADRPLSECA